MACKMETCKECIKKCLSLHGKRDSSPLATSFFKVMVGDKFKEVLFLPPKFVRELASLVGKKTCLEDSNGERWKVNVSTVDGSLAFQQGWDKFASDHSLQEGYFLVFSYIIGSHFVVKIFDKSTCEKLSFSERTNVTTNGTTGKRKRAKSKHPSDGFPTEARKSAPTNGPCKIIDRVSINEQGSSSTVISSDIEIIECDAKDMEKVPVANGNKRPQDLPKVDCAEVPYYMIDRNSITEQGESFSLFDLSKFEMLGSTSDCKKSNKISVNVEKEKCPYGDERSEIPPAPLEQGRVDKNPVADESSERPQTLLEEGRFHNDPVADTNRAAPFDGSGFKMSEEKWNAEDMPRVPQITESCYQNSPTLPQTTCLVDLVENERGNEILNRAINQGAGKCPERKSQEEHTPFVGISRSICPITWTSDHSVTVAGKKLPRVVKEEHVEITKEVHAAKEPKVIKEEFEENAYSTLKDQVKVCKMVKTEIVDSIDLPSPNLGDFCIPVSTVTQSWLV
ncbi:PREDICTED: uncharacterized protein LOC104591600 isoform X2 [Nelumbo nucifera]|uniref:Uncharacterized protein LOC104591600 isoform X2 n=2 Tax=Nelumbo nucifera TaxID=4432 RepID=A0A1U7ZLN0_NELNU|nr:PREDICTED: uncharacterized protein LOC104591600 isoform X2 [Nelumbo nucifera]DAD30686.1 TPA_asm: hypothetical protein HUJ06_009537 [Nelumbo nucifera]